MHAKYQVLGGEDVSHRTEVEFLRASGHQVEDLTVANADFARKGAANSFIDLTFNKSIYEQTKCLMSRFEPDVLYLNNTFPALSPSPLKAAREYRVPIVQVLRNYRMGCIAGTTFREGHDCLKCVGRSIPLSGVRHACYRSSRAASAAVTAAKMIQNASGLSRMADLYIAVSEHVKAIAIASGIEAQRIVVRPNLVWPDPPLVEIEGYKSTAPFIFVGRDTQEKGLHVLLDAIRMIDEPGLKLDVYGCSRPTDYEDHRVVFHGQVEPRIVSEAMPGAASVVVPSIWPEPFGRVVIEALACGSPVIASQVGGMADFNGPGVTLVNPGDAASLAQALLVSLTQTPAESAARRTEAKAYYDREFSSNQWLEATNSILSAATYKDD